MPCLCTTNTLRLFIRSLAQVDIVRTGPAHLSQKCVQKSLKRNFVSFQPLRQQNETSDHPLGTSSLSHSEYTGATSSNNGEPAFAELSPESIDLIAKESSSYIALPRSSVQTKPSDKLSAKRDSRTKPSPTAIFRRTKVQNTSFTLHYSSPRAPSDGHSKSEPLPTSKRETAPESDLTPRPKSRQRVSEQDDWEPPAREQWQIDKAALKEKFPEGWKPIKRLSPDALAGIRALHAQMPTVYTTGVLAEHFQISPEAIRRILKSKWSPDAEEETDRQRRWFNRGKKVYTIHAEKGQKPPKKWRELGIGNGRPEWLLRKQARAPLPALITTARRRELKLEKEPFVEPLAERLL